MSSGLGPAETRWAMFATFWDGLPAPGTQAAVGERMWSRKPVRGATEKL
jgi:hypothetical protein